MLRWIAIEDEFFPLSQVRSIKQHGNEVRLALPSEIQSVHCFAVEVADKVMDRIWDYLEDEDSDGIVCLSALATKIAREMGVLPKWMTDAEKEDDDPEDKNEL